MIRRLNKNANKKAEVGGGSLLLLQRKFIPQCLAFLKKIEQVVTELQTCLTGMKALAVGSPEAHKQWIITIFFLLASGPPSSMVAEDLDNQVLDLPDVQFSHF